LAAFWCPEALGVEIFFGVEIFLNEQRALE